MAATRNEKIGYAAGGAGILLAAYLGYQYIINRIASPNSGGLTPTPTLTELPPTFTPTPTMEATFTPTVEVAENNWLGTPEQMAQMCAGTPSDWIRNPEWPDSRTIDNLDLGISGYVNREMRPTNPENLPFDWPKTAEEAVGYFFPNQNIDPIFLQPAWRDSTGLITGWHLSEDHWLVDGSPADVNLTLHACEVAEGYTVNGTQDPQDDRNWVAFGGDRNINPDGETLNFPKGQGMTIWMPGTDPNAIALRMELFKAGDTPYYTGANGEQLGPDAYGFDPVYPTANQ